MKINGTEAIETGCVAAVDGSRVFYNGVEYIPSRQTTTETMPSMTERKEPEVAILDALIDLSGYYPNQVADLLPEKLRQAGYAIVPILSANQCGTCQHYSWEHVGPVHPCKQCDCERYKPADPDRQDDDLPEPD